jgi:Uma2 family endonuclease
MPAVEERKLTIEEFHARYDGVKPYYEFWAGEAVQKSTPTSLHSLIEKILMMLLDALGLESAAEVTLNLDPTFAPVPDVIAVEGRLEQPYPVRPFPVVIEILSPQDSFTRVVRKCQFYAQWGLERILVIDPADRVIWSLEGGALEETNLIARRGEKSVSASDLWAEVDRRTAP